MDNKNIDIRDAFFDQMYCSVKSRDDFVFLSADMDAFSLKKFSKDFPQRFFNIGVSEQNMINVACGLALAGKKVFCYSIASFATIRCLEQIKINLCSMDLPVTIIGAGAGFSFGYDGPTHHGHQDLSSMRLLPEMTILEISSLNIARKSVEFVLTKQGPTYIRLDKGIFPERSEEVIDFDKGYIIVSPIKKINIISNGYMFNNARLIVNKLESRGFEIGLIDLYKVKPLSKTIHKLIEKSDVLISIEESCISGGLATILCEEILFNDLKCRFLPIGAPNKQFIEYGDRSWFHSKYELDNESIENTIVKFLNK